MTVLTTLSPSKSFTPAANHEPTIEKAALAAHRHAKNFQSG